MLRKEPVEREGRKDEQGLPSPNGPSALERSGRMPSPGRSGEEGTGRVSAGDLRGQVLESGLAFLRYGGRWPCCWLSRQAEHDFGAYQIERRL